MKSEISTDTQRDIEAQAQAGAFLQELADMCEWKDGRILNVTGDTKALYAKKYPQCQIDLKMAMLVVKKRREA